MKLEGIKVSSSEYLGRLSAQFFAANGVWLALPLLVGFVLAFQDIRWLIVTLMLLFVAFPMLLSLCYINYALSMEARWSLMEKDITLETAGLLLQFADERMHDRLIAWREVSRVVVDNDYVMLMLKVRRFTFLLIPRSSIADPSIIVALRQGVADSVE
ncbi:MAG: hypothetical protein II786_03585 [Muribaculaceae bacterium]|nr:hypothetical protein [Muribaculaceae bacterium]